MDIAMRASPAGTRCRWAMPRASCRSRACWRERPHCDPHPMRVLVVGSGGREAAIAWACLKHGHDVTVAPGLADVSAAEVDLVIPGPEALLAAGIADECASRGIACFGPTADLARLESSKTFARSLATD